MITRCSRKPRPAPPSSGATVGPSTPSVPSIGHNRRGNGSDASISAASGAISRSANERTGCRSSSSPIRSAAVSGASIAGSFPPYARGNPWRSPAIRWPDGLAGRAPAEESMPRLATHLDTGAQTFRDNTASMQTLVADLRSRRDRVRGGGGEDAVAKHEARGKLTAHARVEALLDPSTTFLELSPLAAEDLYDGAAPGAGIVTGIGPVHGQPCVVIANDATVKGGTYFPMTVKKHLRAQEIAADNRLPCIYLVDSGGAFLPLQADVFPDRDHFGRIFYNQARMSAAGIPQIAAVMGSCTAGGAYVPAMSDETVIVRGTGTIFLGGPPLVKAATGEDVSAEDLGGGEVHTTTSGVADHLALDDEHAIALGRSIVANLNRKPPALPWDRQPPEPPAVDPCGAPDVADLYAAVSADARRPVPVRELIA